MCPHSAIKVSGPREFRVWGFFKGKFVLKFHFASLFQVVCGQEGVLAALIRSCLVPTMSITEAVSLLLAWRMAILPALSSSQWEPQSWSVRTMSDSGITFRDSPRAPCGLPDAPYSPFWHLLLYPLSAHSEVNPGQIWTWIPLFS